MCVIWASLGFRPARAVIDVAAHRGPDGEGWHEFDTGNGPLVLAHRRLAVIDTTDAGLQPMSYADGRYWLVYNGVIYNHVELRDELIELGHRFQSQSDSEVLLAAYAQWDEGCLDRFNGMFAFVIWDSVAKTLFAARDRFGIKPLYWIETAQGIAFASEIKQFFAMPSFTPRLNTARAYDFLAFEQLDHTAQTLFEGIRQLRGGESIMLETTAWRSGEGLSPQPWYQRPVPGSLDLSSDVAQQTLLELLSDSVRLRLRSDVPVGSCLSGGLDSSTIVSLADGHASGDRLVTVSAVYEDFQFDERPYIDAVTETTDTRPIQVFPDAGGLADTLDNLVYHQDEPFGSTSLFAQWCVFKAAREAGVTVMLDGQGADELLSGYTSCFAALFTGLLRGGRAGRLVREMAGHRRRHSGSLAWQGAVVVNAALPASLRRSIRNFRQPANPGWLRNEFTGAFSSPAPVINGLTDLMMAQTFDSTLPALLHYEDRNSMAHGIESRLPFLDYRVVELLIGLGERHKILDGETKWLLRRAMSGVLPDRIRDRQDKIGFATPQGTWLSTVAQPLVERGVEDALELFPSLFSAHRLRRFHADWVAGREQNHAALWRIICFAAWGRTFNVGT